MTARQSATGNAASANAALNAILTAANVNSGLAPVLPAPLTNNIDHQMRDFGVTIDTTGVIKSSMIVVLRSIPGLPYPRVGADGEAITMVTTAGDPATVGSSANVAAIENNANGNFLKQVIAALPAARTWLLDLAAAHQVRALTPKNVEGYFMSKGNTKVIGRDLLQVIDYAARGLPNIMQDEGARNAINYQASDWIKYHTSATSTAGLVHRVKDTLVAIFPTLFKAETITAIDAAFNAQWNKELVDRVPKTALAISFIWLREAKQLPEDWFQGTKAYNDFNPATSRSLSNLFKRYLSLSADDSATASVTKIDDLVKLQSTTGGLHGY